MSSKHFTEQIRHLEQEGAKLLAATHSLGDSMHLQNDSRVVSSPLRSSSRGITSQLSALADISAEQKTIADLRKNLDEQCNETNRLHKEMFNTSGSYRVPPRASALANLEIPISTDLPSTTSKQYSSSKDYSFTQTNKEDFHLRESQREINDLRSRLKEAISISEQQKSHFRSNIQDLHGQLNTVLSERDALLQRSKRDMGDKDLTIERLQETVSQLERANKLQEETLLELNEKLESYQKEQYMVDTSISQLRSLLLEREHRRKRPFYENDPVHKQSITVLVHSIEKCIQDLDYDIHQKQDKVDHLLLEVDDLKVTSERKLDQCTLDQERKLTRLQDDHDHAVLRLTEQYTSFKDEATLLQDKVNTLEKQLEQQIRLREDQVKDLENRMYSQKQEYDAARREWQDRKSSLEMALDESQKELALSKGEKDASIRNSAQIESRFCDMQTLVDRLNVELTEERQKSLDLLEKEACARTAQERLQIHIKHKDQVLAELEQKVKVVKQEADTKIQSVISNMEKEGRAYIEKEISTLKTQVEALTDRCHKLQLELEVTKSEYKNSQERLKETKDSLEKVTSQLEQSNSKKESISALLNEKINDIERVTHEKDYYFKLIDDRNQEINTLKALKEKFSIQMEEREKNFVSLQQQNDKMSALVSDNTKSSSEIRSERDSLKQQCNEKSLEIDELRKLQDQLNNKIKLKEKKIQALEEENLKVSGELGEKRSDSGKLIREKEKLYDELKSSRYEVSKLEEDKRKLEQQLKTKDNESGKELSRLNKKVKSTESDLKLAKRTLKTREEVDGKAVKVAGKMQKEVTEKRGQIDTLQTRIRWLEECLDAAIKDKSVLQEDNEKLSTTIFKLGKQNDKLSQELQNNLTKNKSLREKIVKLEAALEKAAVKNAAVQAEVEQHQQEIARLQLKHQLQLKEMNRNGNIKAYYNPLEQARSHPVSENTVKSSMLTNSTKITTPYLTKTSTKSALDSNEKPVRDKPPKGKGATVTDDGEVGHELRSLLGEMRNLLQGHQTHKPENGRLNTNDSTVFSDSELDPRSYQKYKPSKSRHKHRSHTKGKHKGRSASPVSDLLVTSSVFDGAQSDTMLSPVSLDETNDTYFNYNIKPTKPLSAPHKDSGDVCKRLEKKIENLSKMGTQLQQENQEMAKVMKDQDKKLKKVKSQMVK